MTDLRPMSAGEILDRAFQLFRGNFAVMFLTGLVTLLPFGVASGSTAFVGENPVVLVLLVVGFIAAVILTVAGWAALGYEAHLIVIGEQPRIGPSIRTGLRLTLRLVFLYILLYLLLIGLMIPVALVGGLGVGGVSVLPEGAPSVAGAIVVGLVTAAVAVVMAVIWMSTSTMAFATVVSEQKGAVHALRRASELSKGARVRITAVSMIAWLISILPMVGIVLLLGMGEAVIQPDVVATQSPVQYYMYQMLVFGVSALTTPLVVSIMVLLYYDRRIRREGYDVEVVSATAGAGV